MTQNHSPTWDRKFGNLEICAKLYEKAFITHSFKKVIKQWKPHACPRRLHLSGWFRYIFIYIYIYIYVIFNFILLEHYLLQFYISFYTSVN